MYYYLPALTRNVPFSLYTRYRHRLDYGRFAVEVYGQGGTILWRLPDRDVLAVCRGQVVEDNWDAVIRCPDYDWFDAFLLSVLEASPDELREAKRRLREGAMVVSDSGGAQILTGAKDYVDPVELVIANLELRPSAAVALDLPQRGFGMTKETIEAASYVQNKLIRRYFRPTADRIPWLVPIHGRTEEILRVYLKNNWDDRFRGAAVAASYTQYPYVLSLVHRVTRADRIHLLGIGSATSALVLPWLGRYIPVLTSDSATFSVNAIARTYFYLSPGATIAQCTIGPRYGLRLQYGAPTPCACPVCQMVGWLGVYATPKALAVYLLRTHNAFVLYHSAYVLAHYAPQASLEDYQAHLRAAGVEKDSPVLLWLRFISLFYEDGPREARLFYERSGLSSRVGASKIRFRPGSVWGGEIRLQRSLRVKEHTRGMVPVLSCYLTPEEMKRFDLPWQHPFTVEGFVPPDQRATRWRKFRAKLRRILADV